MRAAVRGPPDIPEPWERHAGAAHAPLGGYRRREPEKTLLHQVVCEELESFLAAARERSEHGRGLPAFVERELRAYLDCGILARGFARVRCPDCGFERLVAFSCKAHVCPSCATRRMEDGSDHLVRNVLPPVPVRQWVFSLPRRVRFLAARYPVLASRLLDVFTRAVFDWQKRSARRLGASEPRTGGVTAIQRFGGALNLNVHFHTLIPDGVFLAEGDGPAHFFPVPQPRDEDVAAILVRIVRRTAKVIVGFDEDLDSEADALAALQAAEVERRQRYPEPFEQTRRGAFLDGFSLHAGVRIHANDRNGRERLCRYILRPPLALHRLSRGDDGGLLYRMKRPRHGSSWLALTPDELLAKLATLVPPPRVHGLRYHGVFAPHARLRSRVAPEPVSQPAAPQLPAPPSPPSKVIDHLLPLRTYRVPWADLLKKVFAIDVLACPECGGRLRLIAFIAEATVARRILDHLGFDSTGPPVAPARDEPAPDYDLADPIYEA
jgi:hypothetical protein